MKLNRLTTLSSIFILLSGCSLLGPTPYAPMALAGGYSDAHIKDNLYYVEFSGNAYINRGTVFQYFHRRAKEVCLENGYSDYKIKGAADVSTEYVVGSYGSGAITASSMNKPSFAGEVICIK